MDEIFEQLKKDFGSVVQEALDWQARDGGTVEFRVEINRQAKHEIDERAVIEAMKPENILARLDALEGKTR